MSDTKLLQQFVEVGSEEAFRRLVERHQTMVYNTCLRGLNGDVGLAEDAAQAVFIVLARKAKRIRNRRGLARWLFRTADFVVAHMRRDEARRRRREEVAAELAHVQRQTRCELPWWTGMEHLVNEAVSGLGRRYREAVVLHFLQGKPQREVAEELGCSEVAVSMRISRAVGRMRARLAKRGVVVSAAALAAYLTEETAHAAATGLAASCNATAMAAVSGSLDSASAPAALAKGAMNMMTWAKVKVVTVALCAAGTVSAGVTAAVDVANRNGPAAPGREERVTVVLPDFGAELRACGEPDKNPVAWWPHVANAAWGHGSGGPERRDGWMAENWRLVDYVDRSNDYASHEWLKHRGIWYEVYGSNEYQETIHFHEKGAREWFWDNGVARDMNGERVLSEHYNKNVKSWAAGFPNGKAWDAYIVCNNAPRWSAVIDYDWLSSPLLGYAISQDNIGGPVSRIGRGGHGRYCDYCNAKFFHYLQTTGRLPDFRRRYTHIRDYVQDHLMDTVRQLPPHVRRRWNAAEAKLLARMCEPPVMSEYQKFLYLSHLHNLMRYYRDAKLVAARAGRQYDVHGNQGGGFVGPDPYQVALSDFVDTVWFESKGLSNYDIFKHGWNNAWGSLRYVMGRAMTRGRKPFMSMTGFHKWSPDIVEHEMAEACAGGGVLFVQQYLFAKRPELLAKMTEYYRFRHEHRALFADAGKDRYAQIALAYSVPTMMYRNYQFAGAAPPVSALSGMARALEEGHLPFDVVILNHPEIHADRVALAELTRYRLVVLPALECLADSHVSLCAEYLRAGGTLGVIGECGTRDEDNLPRPEPPLARWRGLGRVLDLLPGRTFLPHRDKESDESRELAHAAIEATRTALGGRTLVSGDLPRMLWVKTWKHRDEWLSLHFVNYDIDFESGLANATRPIEMCVTLPAGLPAEEAVWWTPDGQRRQLALAVAGGRATVTLPAIRVYGLLVLGRRGLEERRSLVLQGDALLARAAMACDGRWGDLADQATAVRRLSLRGEERGCTIDEAGEYAKAADALLQAVRRAEGDAYLARIRAAGAGDGAKLAFDFGGTHPRAPWRAVGAESSYAPETGFGWLAPGEDSTPTPEETYYGHPTRFPSSISTEITAQGSAFWPYEANLPACLLRNLACGAPRRFRVDVPAGDYTVRVVTTDPSWLPTTRNFQVSGMVRVNEAPSLLDAVHDEYGFVAREFPVSTAEGGLEFTFGGPTGWAVAALAILPGGRATADPQAAGGLRSWRVSPRYANPDWYPITQVFASPERRMHSLPDAGWETVEAARSGLPVVDLGSNLKAEVGDVVYAVSTVHMPAARTMALHFGASSQAQLWLNGAYLGYVPNEKGLRRDEWVVPLQLKAGENRLVVKLQRFWERRWMYYASLTGEPPVPSAPGSP